MACSRRRPLALAVALVLSACGGGGAGESPSPECAAPSDCPGADTACRARTCTGGSCGFADVAAGTRIAAQTPGDCQAVECDGAGGTRSVADGADVPADANACTRGACAAGAPSSTFAPAGTACAQGGGTQCDGNGACVECLAASDCPGSDTECATRTCVAGACGLAYAAAGTALASQAPGDCQRVECDGGGGTRSVADDADVPADANACTDDACTAGVPSNAFARSGTACAQGGGSLCDGAGTCVQCLAASDCPGSDTECATRTCTAGVCGVSYAAAGTALASQAPGDCQVRECDGAGATRSAADDADVPVDGNACTVDACRAGVPSHANALAGTACAQSGGTRCDGDGACVQCLAASDCPGSDTECATRTCVAGACGVSYAADGTALAAQTPGDCRVSECDGRGATRSAVDDADVPVDGNACTRDVCTDGIPSNPSAQAGSACAQDGGTMCDGSGLCVECVAASDCAGADTECRTRTCTAGLCGATYAAAGTALAAQTAGDCQVVECDGAGATRSVADDADVPVDGRQCTGDTCTAGVASNPNVAAGTACNQDGGLLCDGNGACVACMTASDCPGSDTECATRTCTAGTCGVQYVPQGTALASQTAGDCQVVACDGAGATLSVADDADVPVDGNECTGDTCTAGVPSNPSTAAGTACAQGGGTFCDGNGSCVQCLTGGECPSGVCLAGRCQSATSVVVSQVYGGGGGTTAAVVYQNDFVELHNRSGSPVSLEGWSVQYGSATGTTWQVTALHGVIQPGGYYLVSEGGGPVGAPLPLPPDASGTIAMSATAGKIALVRSTFALSGCPSGQTEDLVGYGAANCAETRPTPALMASFAAARPGPGCQDSDDNAADLVVATPAPRGSGSAPVVCSGAVNETGLAAEADFCNVQFPASLAVQPGATTPFVYGQLYEAGVTEAAGAPAGVVAQLGYGPGGTDPRADGGWTFVPAAYNTQVGNDDEYMGSFTAPAAGTWAFAFRFSLDGASTWTYCDLDGSGSNASLTFDVSQLGVMTVAP